MRRFLVSVGIAIVTLSLAAASVVQADVIPGPIVTLNGVTTVFQTDGFESDTVGAAPSVTTTGSWSLYNPQGVDLNHSLVYAGGGTRPAASQGAKLLEMWDSSGNANNTHATAVFGTAAAPTETVQAKFNVYIDSAGNTCTSGDGLTMMANFATDVAATPGFSTCTSFFGFAFQGGDVDSLLDNTGMGAHDMFASYYNGSTYVNTKLSDGVTNMYMSPDAWHSVQLDLTVGTGYTVTIDGVTSSVMTLKGLAGANVLGLDFMANTGNDNALFYLDGQTVPEPSTIILLAIGAIGLLAYAWRKQK